MFRFQCGQCGATLQVANDTAGKRGRCPNCQTLNVVPFPRDESSIPIGRIAEPAPGTSAPGTPSTGGGTTAAEARSGAEAGGIDAAGGARRPGRPQTPLEADGAGQHGGATPPPLPASGTAPRPDTSEPGAADDDLAALAGAAASNASGGVEPAADLPSGTVAGHGGAGGGPGAPGHRRASAHRRGGRGRGSARSVAVACGIMLLLTVGIPWSVTAEVTEEDQLRAVPHFAWDVLAAGPPMWWVYMLGAWLIGALVLIFSGTLMHLARGVAYLACGGAGLLLVLGVSLVGAEPLELILPAEQTLWLLLSTLWLLGAVAALIGLHIRGHLGRGPGSRTLVGSTTGTMALLTIVLLVGGVTAYANMAGPALAMTLWFLGGVLVAALMIVGSVLAMLDVAAKRRRYVAQALLCDYLGLFVFTLWLMIGAVLEEGAGTAILPILNLIILGLGAFLALVVVGTVTLAVDLQQGEPIEAPARGSAASAIEPRLREVQQMLRDGTITREEYQQLRQRILNRV